MRFLQIGLPDRQYGPILAGILSAGSAGSILRRNHCCQALAASRYLGSGSNAQLVTYCLCAQVNNRIERKRIHVRVEHVYPSRCKEEFLRRQKQNDEAKHDAHVRGGELHTACRTGSC